MSIRRLWKLLWLSDPNRIKLLGRDRILYRIQGREVTLQGEAMAGNEAEVFFLIPKNQRWDKPKGVIISDQDKNVLVDRVMREVPRIDGVLVKIDLQG